MPQQVQHPQHHQHPHPPTGPPSQHHSIPMSPWTQSPPLQGLSTNTQSHTIPNTMHTPTHHTNTSHSHMHNNSIGGLNSPLLTPSTSINKLEKEKDGWTLIQAIQLIFKKVSDEAAWSKMYAYLCRKMMDQPQGAGQWHQESQEQICRGQLFQKYLLNRGQEDFLDTNKAHTHMDVYFFRMKELMRSSNVSSHMQYMLQAYNCAFSISIYQLIMYAQSES